MNWQSFSWVDWVLVAMFVISIGFSIARGFIRETLSLAVWILAIFISYLLGDELASLLGNWITDPSFRITIGMAILFILTLLVGALLNNLLSEMLEKSGLTAADRILGSFFGLARGVVIAMVLTLFVPVSIKHSVGWQHSKLVPQFQAWEIASRATVQSMGAFIHRTITHNV